MNAKARTIDQCAVSWQLSLQAERKAARTVETYAESLEQFNRFLKDRDLPTDVSLIEREHVEAYVDWLLARPGEGAASTASLRYRALNRFFKWLVKDENEIDESPMAKTTAPKPREKLVKVFTDGEVEALLDACRGTSFNALRDTAIIRLLDDTGMRRKELCALKLDDLSITGDGGQAFVIGKGDKPRTVSFGVDAAIALDRYIQRARSKHSNADSPNLWLGRSQTSSITPNGVAQMLRRRGEQAGVPNVHAHRFRHTMAHEWKMEGGNDTALMAQAGWTSPQMLLRYGKSAAQSLAQKEFDRVRGGRGRRVAAAL